MTPLRTRDLTHRITIRRAAQLGDGKGGFLASWTVLTVAMAEITGLDGRESVMGRVLVGVSVYRLRIRWRRGLDIRASDQVRLADGTELNITAPAADPDGQREQLVIMAESGTARSTD